MLSHKEQIGRLDRRITFQQKVFGSDVSNQKKIIGWENIDTTPTVWASVDEVSGSEVIQADQLSALESAVFVIRYRTDIDVEYRIVYDGEYWDIHAVHQVGRKRYLRIVAESGGQYTGEDVLLGEFSEDFSDDFNT